MLPDPHIQSILHRYKHNKPLSPEEKAKLHVWLTSSVRHTRIYQDINNISSSKVPSPKRKHSYWQFAVISLILSLVILIIYMAFS